MAATLCSKFLPKQCWLPLAHTVRHGSKAVTRHKKPIHFLKQKLLAVTEYIPPRAEGCSRAPRITHMKQDSRVVVFLKKELQATFQQFKMIAVVQNNASTAEDILMLKHRLHKHSISIKFFPNQVVRDYLAGSKYSNMEPLIIGPTIMLVSKEPKVKEMLQILRGSPQMVLIGACVEDTLLSRQGIVKYSKLPSLTAIQGQVVSGLSVLTSQTAAMLHRHPAHLSALLKQYIKQQSEETSEVRAPEELRQEIGERTAVGPWV
ncbi:39S ribosomal protein L10, mitochondrial [Arapaima gigas]